MLIMGSCEGGSCVDAAQMGTFLNAFFFLLLILSFSTGLKVAPVLLLWALRCLCSELWNQHFLAMLCSLEHSN